MIRTCAVCGSEFHGRADARYCSPACRQKSYRTRQSDAAPKITAAEQTRMLTSTLVATLPETLALVDPLTKLHLAEILRAGAEAVAESIEQDKATGWRPTRTESRRVKDAKDRILSGGCNAIWLIPDEPREP